jgi:hypothetical protein
VALGCFFPYGLFKGDIRVKKSTRMKKKHMARLVLGMTLLGSFLTGYGMESNEVIEKQKGGATQATDKLEQGECFVSKKAFKEYFHYFLKDHTKFLKIEKDTQLSSDDILENSLKQVFNDKIPIVYVLGLRGCDNFETNAGPIRGALEGEYMTACIWLRHNTEKWVGKFKDFLSEKDPGKYTVSEKDPGKYTYASNDLSPLLESGHFNIFSGPNRLNQIGGDLLSLLEKEYLYGFLRFLSDKKDPDQMLKDQLKNLTPKKGVFQQKYKDSCAEELSKSILDFLDFENKCDPIRCRFYDRVGRDNIKRSYCKVYIDLRGFIKCPYYDYFIKGPYYDYIGKVYCFKAEKYETTILAMVFAQDSQDSFKVSLRNAYPWLGRDAFLKVRDKAGYQNPDNLAEEMENLSLEAPQIKDDKLREFFSKNNRDKFQGIPFFPRWSPQKEKSLQEKGGGDVIQGLFDWQEVIPSHWRSLVKSMIPSYFRDLEKHCGNRRGALDRLNAIRGYLGQTKEEYNLLEKKIGMLKEANLRQEHRHHLVRMELDQTKKECSTLGGEKQNLERFNGDLSQKIIVLELQSVEREKNMQDQLDFVRTGLDQAKKECSTLEEEKQNLERLNGDLSQKVIVLEAKLVEREKESDILGKEIERLAKALKKEKGQSNCNLYCLVFMSMPTLMFCLRWGLLEFSQAQEF